MKPEQLIILPPEASKDSSKIELVKVNQNDAKIKELDHVSFSQLLVMQMCPWQHFEKYVLGKKSEQTIFTTFGTLAGVALEQNIQHGNKQSWISFLKEIIKFINSSEVSNEDLEKSYFKTWCKKNDKEITEENYRRFNIESFCNSALRIYKDIILYFENDLKEWEVISFEIPLLEPIDGIELKFKGYIDCVLKHKTEDRYKILDFKTCSWGWDNETKSDTAKLYQVILYKKYWCEKNNIDTKKVECAYLLLKRSPAKKDISAIEMFDITSGDRKLNNAELWMLETLKKIFNNVKIKTVDTCKYCNCGKQKRKYF